MVNMHGGEATSSPWIKIILVIWEYKHNNNSDDDKSKSDDLVLQLYSYKFTCIY